MFVFFPRPIVDLRDRFYATCHPGLEEVVAAELSSPLIGAIDVAPGGAAVYDFVKGAAPWEDVVPGGVGARDPLTFSVESRVWSCSDVTSTRLASTRAKDAVCDALVDATGYVVKDRLMTK